MALRNIVRTDQHVDPPLYQISQIWGKENFGKTLMHQNLKDTNNNKSTHTLYEGHMKLCGFSLPGSATTSQSLDPTLFLFSTLPLFEPSNQIQMVT